MKTNIRGHRIKDENIIVVMINGNHYFKKIGKEVNFEAELYFLINELYFSVTSLVVLNNIELDEDEENKFINLIEEDEVLISQLESMNY